MTSRAPDHPVVLRIIINSVQLKIVGRSDGGTGGGRGTHIIIGSII